MAYDDTAVASSSLKAGCPNGLQTIPTYVRSKPRRYRSVNGALFEFFRCISGAFAAACETQRWI